MQANKLPRGAGGRTQRMTAYVRVKCGEEERETPPVTSAAEHVFNSRNVFEFYNVKFSADIKFKVRAAAVVPFSAAARRGGGRPPRRAPR